MIALIAAYDKNRLIGNHGAMPWQIEGEQRRFRELTIGNVIVMGRKTYEDIGRPLPNRINIVVSSSCRFEGENLYTVSDLNEALKLFPDKDIYISGGSRIFAESLPYAEKLYITEIDGEFDGDVYFPEFDENSYTKEIIEYNEGKIPYTYVTYTKK